MTIEPDQLLQLLWTVARSRGYTCQRTGPDTVEVDGRRSFTLVPSHLRRLVATYPPHQWPTVVAEHLDTIAVTIAADRDDPLDYTDFAVMRHLVRTRLYGTVPIGTNGVRRIIAPGLIQRVVIDRIHSATHVTYDMLAQWPIGEWELFDLAESNVRTDGGVHIKHDSFDGVPMAEEIAPIALLTGPEYLTAHTRWLGDHPVTGPRGAVLTMPSKESIYAYPVTGIEVVKAITVLARLAALHTEDPWPINQSVYWWRNGHLDLAATTRRTDTTVVITPADAFYRNTAHLDHEPDDCR
ncbi:hypothetical protein ACGF5S_17065 [Nocardia nova]|uniref:hypothetical protein n=1 Tax=Nocardia nova TaxID=37330 RepID=UPI00370FB047